jgi:hypothetical protein
MNAKRDDHRRRPEARGARDAMGRRIAPAPRTNCPDVEAARQAAGDGAHKIRAGAHPQGLAPFPFHLALDSAHSHAKNIGRIFLSRNNSPAPRGLLEQARRPQNVAFIPA